MEDSDFRSMRRRDLQALCKKHCIPANSTNALMADRLAALFSKKGNEDPMPVGPSCFKGSDGSGGLQGDGHYTRSKRKRVTFLLPEGDPDLEEAGDCNDLGGKDSPELAAAVLAPRTTRSRALRLQGDAETAKHPNVDRNSAATFKQAYHDCMVDEGLMALRQRLRGVVTHADGAPRRSRRLRDPGLTEEIGAVAAVAVTPAAVPVPEVSQRIEVGSRRGSRKHQQDPMPVMSTSPQGSAPAAENVARGVSETGGPRRSKRNHRNPELTMAGSGALEISATEIPEVVVEAEKEGSAQILEPRRISRRKSVRFRTEEMEDGVHTGAVGDKLQRQTRKNAPEPADEGISALACESKNVHGASCNAKKSEVPQGGEHLRRSKRKSLHDILLTEGANSEDDDGRVAGAVLPSKVNIQTTKKGAAFVRENGKITGSLEVHENSTKVSDYDEPTKRKRKRSVRCGVAEQKVFLPQIEKQGNDKDHVEKKCSQETESQRSDKDSPETFPFSDNIFDGNVVMGDVQDSAEPSQLGEITKEAIYQSSEDISKQEEMVDGVVQNGYGGLWPTEPLLATDVPLEKPKIGTEPDRMGIQHEEHDKPEEDIKKFEFESFKEGSQVNYMGSPAVTNRSHVSYDQAQKEDLPGFSPSIMKATEEHSHANEKESVRESCDGDVQSSFKESSEKASYISECPEEDVGPNEEPDCAKLSEHVINDSDDKISTDMMEMQSSPGHGLSPISEAYNQGCNLTLEITEVGDDGASSLSNSFKQTRIEDVTESPLVDDQGSESHDSLPPDLLMGNKNKEVPVEASEITLSSAETFKTGGILSPGSDGRHAFSTHSVSYILDDQGSELNGNSLPSPLMRSGDEKVPDEAVASTLSRTRLGKECESSSSDGSRPNGHEVDFSEADDLCGSHAFSNVSEVVQELTGVVDTKENIEVDVNGNFSGRSFSLFGASEKTANLLDRTERRQRNEEPSAPMKNSQCDISPLDIASIASNSMVSRHLVDLNVGDLDTRPEPLYPHNEAGFVADGTCSGQKSLLRSPSTQTEDECVLKETDEIVTGEDGAIKFSDTTLFSSEKEQNLDEHEETMDATTFMCDEVLLINETSTQMKSKEVEVAVDSKRSLEASLNTHPKEGSFDSNRGEAVEATPDAHEHVIPRNKFAYKVADIEDVEGELAIDYAVNFSGHKEIGTPAGREEIGTPAGGDLDRQTKLQNESILVTEEAEDGSVQESLVRDLASGGQFSVPTPLHPTACVEGVELAEVQETGRSAEALDVVVAAQLDEELSSSQGISSELVTVSSDVAVASLSNHKPLCETYNLASNNCLAGDTIVGNRHPFPDSASEETLEYRTEPADLLVNMSIVKEGGPVLNETGEQLVDKIVYNEEFSEDNENSPINVDESGYMDSYRTTERKPCGVGLNKHRETVELIKDAVGSAEMLGTEVSEWMENTVAEGENAYQSTLELEKEIETTGDQLGHIYALFAVETSEVQGTDPDGKCTVGAEESSLQIGELLHGESVIPPIWPTNVGNMNVSEKSPKLSFAETEYDVCGIARMETCLSSNNRDKDRLLELSRLSDVNSASAEILKFSPVIQVIRPDSRADYCVLQAKERTIEHNTSDDTRSEVLRTEKSVRDHDFIDPGGNETKDEKPGSDVSEHNPIYDTNPKVLQTQKSAGDHDFTSYSDNKQEHDYPSRDLLEHNISCESCPEFLQTENAVGGQDFIGNGNNEKEDGKLDGDVSEHNLGHQTCFGVQQTENSVGGHGFINLCENEKEDDTPNRNVPEHKSSYVTYSEGIQTETVGCHDFMYLGEIEKEDDQPSRHVSEQELSSEEVVTPSELVSVEYEVNQLKGEKYEKMSSSMYQTEVYETVSLMSANDCKDHREPGNEDNRSNVRLPEEELEHKAEYGHLLEQNKNTMGQERLVFGFEPEILAGEGRFDGNLKHDIRIFTEDRAMIFAELDDIKHEDASWNRRSSTSDDNYFAPVEGPAFKRSWDLKNTVKDANHGEEAGTVQYQEAVEILTEKPETQQQKEDLQYVNGSDNPYRQDTKDGLTYEKEHETVVSYSVEAHNLGDIVELDATKNSKSSNSLEDLSGESNEYCASVLCTTNEHEQNISKSTEAYTRGHQGEVGEFYRDTQSLEEMHLSDMEIDGKDDEEKLQLASFEELVADTDTTVGNNGDDGEQPLVSMNSTSANFLGESDSACDRPLDIGKAEDGPLVNHFSYAALSDGKKRTPSNLDFAYEEVFPESAILSEVEHFALDGTCVDDKHDSAKEITMVVANDMNTLTLHNVEEENCYPKKDAATITGGCSSCQVEDAVGSLAEEEEKNDVFGGMRISSARNHTITGRISCTPQRNRSSKSSVQIENGKENTPFSKTSHSANIFVEKSTVQTSKRKALANLQNRIHRD